MEMSCIHTNTVASTYTRLLSLWNVASETLATF